MTGLHILSPKWKPQRMLWNTAGSSFQVQNVERKILDESVSTIIIRRLILGSIVGDDGLMLEAIFEIHDGFYTV